MSAEFCHIQFETMDGVLVVRITDNALNVSGTIETISQELAHAVEQSGVQRVLLDFDAVTLISSLMLGKLIGLKNRLASGGGMLVLCNLQPKVYHVFAVTRLTKTLEIKADVAEGLASF